MNRPRAVVMILLGAGSYGLVSPLVKMAYFAGYDAQQLTLAQIIVSFILVFPISLYYKKQYQKMTRKSAYILCSLGFLGTGTSIFYYEALQYLSPSIGIVLLFQFTWVVLLLDSIIHRRWPNLSQWIAALFILIGTLLAVGVGHAADVKWSIEGILLGMGSAVTYGMFLYWTGNVDTAIPAIIKTSVIGLTSLVTCVIVFPLTFLSLLPFPTHSSLVASPGPGLWGWAMAIGILGQVIPPMLFAWGIPVVGGAVAGILSAAELPVGIVSSSLLLHDRIALLQWIGIVSILLGMSLPEFKRVVRVRAKNT